METAKVLRDGNLLNLKTEEHRNKARQVESICWKVVCEQRVLCVNRGVKGVITGIPVEKLKTE